MKKKSARGGAGRNQGRKKLPLEDKKKEIRIFPQQKIVDAAGGDEPIKEELIDYLQKKYMV